MTSKQKERNALAQIKQIVDELGVGSYIGTAFEGCFEIAEQNIENDWGCSMKQRADHAEEREQQITRKFDEAEKRIRELVDTLAKKEKEAQENEEDCQLWINKAKQKDQKIEELAQTIAADEARLDEQAYEILTLKAKLYDYMTKEG